MFNMQGKQPTQRNLAAHCFMKSTIVTQVETQKAEI